MKITCYYIYSCLRWTFILLFAMACSKEPKFQAKKGVQPNKIDKITSEALPGKVKVIINTAQPDEYLYTRIDFQIRKEVIRSVKLSKYEDNILLEGFDSEGKHSITVTPVSKGEVEGDQTIFEVEVLTPSFKAVKNSLKSIFTFSGIKVNFSNPESDPLSINIASIKRDENKIITKIRKQIKTEKGSEYFLGFPPVEDTFYIYVTDRWGNISDSLVMTGTPWKEIQLDKALFREFIIPNQGDELKYNHNYPMVKLWDDLIGESGLSSGFYSKTDVLNEVNKKEAHFSINIGKKAKLSRVKLFHYNGPSSNYTFRYSTPKTFALYGSNSPSNKESLEDWTLIQEFVSTKPANL